MQKLYAKQQEETGGSSSSACAELEEEITVVFTNLVSAGSPPSVHVSELLRSVQVCGCTDSK